MKCIRVHDWCQPEDLKIEEAPSPIAASGEVLVRVTAAALNFADLLMIKGDYQVKPDRPFIPGMEMAGVIESLGDGVKGFAPGQRVMAQTGVGAFAEYVTVPAASLQLTPEGMTDAEAAGFPVVYQTSYFALARRAQMQPGETVLIHSAAGGVGLAALQIARALKAGKIIATVGSDDKLGLLREHGADVALNYETEDFAEIVKRETAGRGADIIFDPVGGRVAERNTKCIAFEGRIIIIGFTSGEIPLFKGNHLLVKNYSVIGLHWGNYRKFKPELVESAWEALRVLHKTGHIKPLVAATYPLEHVAEGMQFLASRRAVGKIVLTP